jgi:hypothetical protein
MDIDIEEYNTVGFMAEVPLTPESLVRISAAKDSLLKLLETEYIHPSIGTTALAMAAFLMVNDLSAASGLPPREESEEVPRTLLVVFNSGNVRFYLDAPVPSKRDEVRIDGDVGEA